MFTDMYLAGKELWKQQLRCPQPRPAMTDEILDDLDLNLSMPKPSAVAKVVSANQSPIHCQFFRLQDCSAPDADMFFKLSKPLSGLTLLGETSMSNVDFFADVFQVVGRESGAVFAMPIDRIFIAKLSLGQRNVISGGFGFEFALIEDTLPRP